MRASRQKTYSAPAIMFKGSGWYVTDYSDKLKAPEGPSRLTPRPSQSATGSEQKTQAPTPGNDSAASSPSSTATPASGGSGDSGQKSSSAPTPTPTPHHLHVLLDIDRTEYCALLLRRLFLGRLLGAGLAAVFTGAGRELLWPADWFVPFGIQA